MFPLLVNLYEFGQFLRILLWISVPMIIVAMLVTTWLHYRRRRKMQDELVLSMGGLDPSADPKVLIAAMKGQLITTPNEAFPGADNPSTTAERTPEPDETTVLPDQQDNDPLYQGILWMKEKYEQYRDLADQKIEELKEQLKKAQQVDQRIENGEASDHLQERFLDLEEKYSTALQQLEVKNRLIDELQDQLLVQTQKIEDLVAKLQKSSQLLLNISQELDNPIPPAQPQPQA